MNFQKQKLHLRGKLGEGKRTKTADVLMETKVWIKSDEACNDMTKHLVKYNTDSMICAHEDKTDACQVIFL